MGRLTSRVVSSRFARAEPPVAGKSLPLPRQSPKPPLHAPFSAGSSTRVDSTIPGEGTATICRAADCPDEDNPRGSLEVESIYYQSMDPIFDFRKCD